MSKLVDTTYAGERTGYLDELESIERGGVCPFCPGYLDARPEEQRPVLHRAGSWRVKLNKWPHPYSTQFADRAGVKARGHFVLFGDAHKTAVTQLDQVDWNDISQLLAWVHNEFQIAGCGVTVRSGDTLYTGATIQHLHLQLYVPEIDSETGKAKVINVSIG
jgi:ATP adenylyltransferase